MQPSSQSGFAPSAGAGGGGGGGGGGGDHVPSGAFWVGQDGNVYVAGNQGVNNAGVADANTNSYWTSRGYGQIADPNVHAVLGDSTTVNAPTLYNGGGGGGGGGTAPKVFNQAGATNTQGTLDQLPGILRDALANEATSYGNTTGKFDQQQAGQQAVYDKSTNTNQNNYDSNFMDSIRAGIHGLGGLMSLLRGTGAGGGTAEELARNAVAGTTATDIRNGADTQQGNQTGLDTTLGNFLTDLQQKRQEAKDTFTNNNSAINRDSNTQAQTLYGDMAKYYGDVGNTGQYNDYMAKAGALTPTIAANSQTHTTPYDTTPVTVKAPPLTAFSGATQPNVLAPDPNGQVGSGIFTMNGPARKETAPVGV